MAGNQTVQPSELIEEAQRSLDGARARSDRAGEGQALLQLGLGHAASGHPVEAANAFEDAAEAARELSDGELLARALANLGSQLHASGSNTEALEISRAAEKEFRAIGDGLGQVRVLANCAVIERALAQPDAAERTVQHAIALARDLDDRELLSALLGLQAELAAQRGELSEARSIRLQAVQAAKRSGDPAQVTTQLEQLGELLLSQSLWDDAVRTYYEASQLHQERNDEFGRYRTVLQLGLVYQHQHRWSETVAALTEALVLCQRLGDELRKPFIEASLASAHLCLQDWEPARRLANDAVAGYRGGDAVGAGRALLTMGQALCGLGRTEEGRAALTEALGVLEPVDPDGAQAARAALQS